MKKVLFLSVILLVSIVFSGCAELNLFQPQPKPADFSYLWTKESEGKLIPLEIAPKNIYGLGLTYASHLKETASDFDPNKPPPVFKKALDSFNTSGEPVKMPTREVMIKSCDEIEPGLGKIMDEKFRELPPLLDYEGELAFVLLEDIDWQRINDTAYAPEIGYFIANDLSARTIAVLGEGMDDPYKYWSASKSYSGFLPVGSVMWVPSSEKPNSVLCITVITTVNGKIRQKQSTSDMIYTPREMLAFIAKRFPDELPQKGDIVLMGTPGGVALKVPAWKAWFAQVLHFDRFKKLSSLIASCKNNKKFLKPGDTVEVSGGMLGDVKTKIV